MAGPPALASSVNPIEMAATPLAFAAGVKERVPVELTDGPAAKSPGFVLPVTVNVSNWLDSLAGPALMEVAQEGNTWGPQSSRTARFEPATNEGGSLTGLTLIVNACEAEESEPPFAVPPLSCSTTVTIAEPFASAAGVYVRDPLLSTAG